MRACVNVSRSLFVHRPFTLSLVVTRSDASQSPRARRFFSAARMAYVFVLKPHVFSSHWHVECRAYEPMVSHICHCAVTCLIMANLMRLMVADVRNLM